MIGGRMKKVVKIFLIAAAVIVVILVTAGIVFSRLAARSEEAFEQLKKEEFAVIEPGLIADGIYTGSYAVFPVDVELRVHVGTGRIESVDITRHVNGQGSAAEAVADRIVEAQSLQVDTVSGATFSSLVILKAVEDALSE